MLRRKFSNLGMKKKHTTTENCEMLAMTLLNVVEQKNRCKVILSNPEPVYWFIFAEWGVAYRKLF